MNLLYLKKFNNYYNKRVKYYSDVEEYINNCEDYSYNAGVDFNPGDNVNTVKVANLSSLHFSPDYLLVLEENDSKAIVSRWFVMEMKRERNGQYTVQLRRDLIADYFEQLKTSPMLVHRGNLSADSPLIYNQEQVAVNQIKTNEIQLKDFTDTSWIVGYIANDSITAEETINAVKAEDLNTVPTIESLGISLNDSTMPEEGGYFHQIHSVKLKVRYNVDFWKSYPINCEYVYATNMFNNFTVVGASENNTDWSFDNGPSNSADGIKAIKTAFNTKKLSIENGLDTYFAGEGIEVISTDDYSEVYALNGKTVRSTQTGLFYTLLIGKQESATTKLRFEKLDNSSLSLYQAVMSAMQLAANDLEATYQYKDKNCVGIEYTDYKTLVSLVPISDAGSARITLKSTHRVLEDAPYSMFCLRNTPLNLALAVKIAEKLDKKCYDLQLLPYCPVATKVDMEDGIPVPSDGANEETDYFNILSSEDEKLDYIYFATSSQGSFIIDTKIEVPLNSIELKVINDCDSYRICSPNYNGIFEFNAAKNGGVDYFEVSYTYKPYQPYIHVNPNFKNLYGSDFNDARGLICGGDFSLPRTTDAWETYQLQNKNYLNIFDKQIETMDKLHLYNMASSGVATLASAAGSGASIGALGGPVAGAIAGGASLLGGMADMHMQTLAFHKQKELTQDVFKMNLQNVRALPTSLSKVGAYNIDNKIFPFLEYYTCTETEKEAFRNKIKYEAMTVGAIGTINDYLDAVDEYNFFKATPIILDDIADDYHLAVAIAQELEQGVYL